MALEQRQNRFRKLWNAQNHPQNLTQNVESNFFKTPARKSRNYFFRGKLHAHLASVFDSNAQTREKDNKFANLELDFAKKTASLFWIALNKFWRD